MNEALFVLKGLIILFAVPLGVFGVILMVADKNIMPKEQQNQMDIIVKVYRDSFKANPLETMVMSASAFYTSLPEVVRVIVEHFKGRSK